MGLSWFYSRTVRRAGHMLKHVDRYLSAQSDILPPEKLQKIRAGRDDLCNAVRANLPKKELRAKMDNMEVIANDNFRPYPAAAWRENVEVLLVAIAVAMAIRTFFIQPFKIPTGSMQPTLFGVTSNPDFMHNPLTDNEARPNPDFEMPNELVAFFRFWYN